MNALQKFLEKYGKDLDIENDQDRAEAWERAFSMSDISRDFEKGELDEDEKNSRKLALAKEMGWI